MNIEKENKKIYKDTFDEVHASENLLRKVKDMKNENTNVVKRISKKVVCAAAALAVIGFVSTNAVVYAATGSTWVNKIRVSIGGKEYEAKITKKDDNNMEVELNGDEKDYSFNITLEGDGSSEDSKIVICDESTGVYLEFEDDRLYLVSGENRIDITDSFNNGVCEGDMEIGDTVYHYVVTEDGGVYGLNIVEKK